MELSDEDSSGSVWAPRPSVWAPLSSQPLCDLLAHSAPLCVFPLLVPVLGRQT